MFNKASTFTVATGQRGEMIEVTDRVAKFVRGGESGIVFVHVPHTTAGCAIQENADPDVCHDVLAKLDRLFPKDEPFFRHAEGNSDSHLKTMLVGNDLSVPFDRGRLQLGRWQGIYLCEFDGPRERTVRVTVLPIGHNVD